MDRKGERRGDDMTAEDYLSGIREWIKNARLIDDRFMCVCLKDDVENVQLMVRIILEKPDLDVSKVQTQEVVKNLIGRDLEFDITATDSLGKRYNIEIQRANAGAGRKRARYHSSVIDAKALRHGQDFDELPETYVIFITEHDPLGGGKPIYHIDRRIEEMNGELFGDEAHIVYVNGSCRDHNTPLGRLLEDFFSKDPEKMNYKSLAKKVRYFKHHQKGLKTMTDTLDDWAKEIADEARQKGLAEGRAEGRAEERKDARKNLKKTREQFAQKLIQAGVMTIEDIADAAGLTVKTVQKLAEKKAA